MAAEPSLNGSAPENMSAAQRLQEKHQADASHHVEIEDAVDEEDIQHPPPSMQNSMLQPSSSPAAPPAEPPSEKAAGKRKAEPGPASAATKQANGSAALNMQSDEAFPALGTGPKPTIPTPSMAWGARRPAPAAATNGLNGHVPSMTSSRASTPTSGIATPASTNASTIPSQPGKGHLQHMPLPGRHKERIQFAPSQLLPRKDLKKPLPDIVRSINKSSKAKVEMKSGPGGNIVFESSGPVDAARQALKDLAQQVGLPVRTRVILLPSKR